MAEKNLTSIYPSEFYNLPHPQTPYCNVQFRKASGANLEKADLWERELTVNPNNFFNSVTIEDNGGIQTVSLTLFDKNFSRLEKSVIKALTITRLANSLIKNPTAKGDDKSYFEFQIDQTSMVNLRLRIGYTEGEKDSDGIIQAASFQEEGFVTRTEGSNPKKKILRSPWIYLQMLGVSFSPKPEGLTVTINAISITGTFIDKAKLMQKYAKLTGTPTNIITDLNKIVKMASSNKLMLEISTGEEPLAYTNKDGKQEIEIMLGGKPVFKKNEAGIREISVEYQPLRRLLDDICSKVAPIIYDHSDKVIPMSNDSNSEGSGIDVKSEEIKRVVKYGYVVDQNKKIEDGFTVKFYYKDAIQNLEKQHSVRCYPWIEHGQTIIKDLQIDTKTDFAQLNLPIALLTEDGTHLYSARGEHPGDLNDDVIEDKMDFTLATIKNITAAMDHDDFKGMFIAETKDMANVSQGISDGTTSDNMVAGQFVREMIHNLNNQVFNGSIDIPGDPFYFFDSNLRPYSYLIKIIVNRPAYYDVLNQDVKNDERTYGITGGEKSYLSGYYVIKKITHRLDSSGYNTNLEIMKFPAPRLLV